MGQKRLMGRAGAYCGGGGRRLPEPPTRTGIPFGIGSQEYSKPRATESILAWLNAANELLETRNTR